MSKKHIQTINDELPEFYLEELERRLETDPLNVGVFVSLHDSGVDTDADADGCSFFICFTNECTEYKKTK